MTFRGPSRGVLAGIKADAQRAKETGETYNPNGTGVAWSHNFLNQKPWHPLSFRNQKKKFEAEERAFKDAKGNQEAQREFEEEQVRLQNQSFLTENDRQRYTELQSVSFMYSKPPGLEAALQRDKAKAKDEAEGARTEGDEKKAGAAALVPKMEPQQRARPVPKVDAVSLLSAKEAMARQQRLELRFHTGYRSPTHGGIDGEADNQQLLVGGSSEEEREEAEEEEAAVLSMSHRATPEDELNSVFAGLAGPADLEQMVAQLPDKQRRRVLRSYAEWKVSHEDKQRAAAKAYLKSAGYRDEKNRKDKKRHKHKKAKKSTRKAREPPIEQRSAKRSRRSASPSDSGSSG